MTTNTTVTKAGDLLPCPFCGNEPSSWEYINKGVLVSCWSENCPLRATTVSVRQWNTRAAPPAEPASAAEGAICHCACHNDPLYCRSCSECNCHKPDPAQSADTPNEAPERIGK
jgi:hypothetical protein